MTNADPSHLLAQCRKDIKRLRADHVKGADPFGLKSADDELRQLGQQILADIQGSLNAEPVSEASQAHVFIASDIYANGGHTAVIGDFVTALIKTGQAAISNCHLILTYINKAECETTRMDAIARTGIPFENVHAISFGHDAASLLQTLHALVALLKKHCPRRSFLFQHPEDVVACAAALPALSREWYLVHHNDSAPSLGLYLTGVQLMDLSPRAAAFSRALGLNPQLLNLTLDTPVKRTQTFLKEGVLVTASSGSASKFHGSYPITYAEVVAHTLAITGGRHVHIGPLQQEMIQAIHEAMLKNGVHLSQWRHVPHVESVAQTLLQENVDLFLVSIPSPGLRTTIEVMASGTPCLWHCINPADDIWRCQTKPESAPLWRNLDDLASILRRLVDRDSLVTQSRIVGEHFEKHYLPGIFTDHLLSILSGGKGAEDIRQNERDIWAAKRIAQMPETEAIPTSSNAPQPYSDSWFGRLVRRLSALSAK